MAIVQTYEIAEGRGVSGAARQSSVYTRAFAIKVDNPATSMADIAQAPGILLGSPHPDDPSVFATSFDCSVSGDLLLYTLNVTYQAPELIDATSDGPGSGGGGGGDGGGGGGYNYATVPADTWSGSSSVAAVPISVDKDDEPILNTANTPIPDLQADKAYASLSLTRSFPTALAAADALVQYANTINSTGWAGTSAKTWKCQGGSWQKQTQSTGGENLTYYSATFNFAYDASEWKIQQVMIGTRDSNGNNITEEMVGGSSSNPITEPVGLNFLGLPVDSSSSPPEKPYTATYYVYQEKDFSYFGTPS